jgi:hypothetical protein
VNTLNFQIDLVHSRKSLLHYLHEGVRNPLIIDTTCNDVDAGSLTANRYAARTERKRQRTGGLTKRPKVKKLIHFA